MVKTVDPGSEATAQDIRNATAEIAREALAGRPPNEAFIEDLTMLKEKGKLYFAIDYSDEGKISKVFIADRL